MSSVGWHDAPAATRAQVEALLLALRQRLRDKLLALYLHGSLAMGCFNPARSDLDLLVVTKSSMGLATQRAVALMLLRLSGAPHPIEITFLRRHDITPWRYPTPFELHYSEAWRERFQEELATSVWRSWSKCKHQDPDLAAHITIVLERGIALFGPPAMHTFPPVPPADYLASILSDVDYARNQIVEKPVYGVLNLCRVYRYVLEQRVNSKAEAGTWALDALPLQFKSLIKQALMAYTNEGAEQQFSPEALQAFADYVDARLYTLKLNRSSVTSAQAHQPGT